MNKVKIDTIKKVITNLELVIKNLQEIIDILENIWTIKNENALYYQDTTNNFDKVSHLIHTILTIKDLFKGVEEVGFYQKLHFYTDKIKVIFANSSDYQEIVNAETINKFRFVNFANATNNNYIELNVLSIKTFLDTVTHPILLDLLKRIDLFINVKIDKLMVELKINESDTTIPVANILKFEEIWDFRFNSYFDTAKNFALIQQTRYQKIINKLQQYLFHLSQGDEFLLSKTCRLVTINILEQQTQLLVSQQSPFKTFYKIRNEFTTKLQTILDMNMMTIEILNNAEIIKNIADRVVNTERCLIYYNKLTFNEYFNNLLHNFVTNEEDNNLSIIASDMKLKLALINNYLIVSNNLILEKLNFAEQKNEMFESKTFGYFLNDLANDFEILEMKKLLAEIKLHSHNLIVTKLYNFNELKQKYFLQTKKNELQIIENNIDVNLLSEERPIRPKVKAFIKEYNYTLEEEIFANQWEQIKDNKINEMLTMSEKQVLSNIINEEIFTLETMLQEVAVNITENVSTCQQIFFDKLKNVFLHLEMIIDTAIVRYFPKYLSISNNQYTQIFVDKVIEYIVFKHSTITIWQNHLLELEKIFAQNSQNKNKNIIFIEQTNFKEVAFLLNQLNKNYNSFKTILMNTTQLDPLPELKLNPQIMEIMRFQNNHDILNFAPMTPNLIDNQPRKLLIAFKSIKTKLIIKQWAGMYPQLLTNFYGNYNDVFAKLETLLATIRFTKTRMSKIDDNILPSYLQGNFNKLLNDIKVEISKLRINMEQYLDDHSTKVKSLYIDCYHEQETLRIRIYQDINKYLIDANILTPTSAGMIDITLNNFQLLLANEQDSEFNRFFGNNWHEQVNTLWEQLSLHIDVLVKTYERIFTITTHYSTDDEKLLNIFKINNTDWFKTRSKPNFCFIPPVVNDSESLSLTATEINTICPLTLPPINLVNDEIQNQQTMLPDWASINESLQTINNSNTYQNTNLWMPSSQPQTFFPTNNNFTLQSAISNSATNILIILSSIFIIAIPVCIFYLLVKKCHARYLSSKSIKPRKRGPTFDLMSPNIINNETRTNSKHEETMLLKPIISRNATNNNNFSVVTINDKDFQNEINNLMTEEDSLHSVSKMYQPSNKGLGY